MGLGALRNLLLRPLVQRALTHSSLLRSPPCAPFRPVLSPLQSSTISPLWTRWDPRSDLHSLTDTRFSKRRPGLANRRKRASLRPPGPYAWVQYVEGEPIPRSRPNEGSIKGRNRIKRIKLHKAFIKSEAKKRKAQMQEANRKKRMERIERKMAAVARERAWAERLVELQKLEEEKAAAAMA